MFNREVVNVNNTLWIVQNMIRIDHMPIISTWKEHLRSDKVLKKNLTIIFVNSYGCRVGRYLIIS